MAFFGGVFTIVNASTGSIKLELKADKQELKADVSSVKADVSSVKLELRVVLAAQVAALIVLGLMMLQQKEG